AALDEIAHAQLAGYDARIDRTILVDEARIARDDGEGPKAAEGNDDVVDHAIGEILLLGIAADVLERQYSEQRQRGGRGGSSGDDRSLAFQQSIAYPRHSDDPLLAVLARAEGLAERRNLHREVTLFDDGARPAGLHQRGLAD